MDFLALLSAALYLITFRCLHCHSV